MRFQPTLVTKTATVAFSIITLLLTPAPAAAQRRWKEIGKTATGNLVYVDPRSIKTVKGIITAWIRVRFVTPVPTPDEGTWGSSEHLAMFNCAKSTLAAKESIIFSDAAGTKVVKRDIIAQPGFGPALGGSMTQVALDYICKTKRSP